MSSYNYKRLQGLIEVRKESLPKVFLGGGEILSVYRNSNQMIVKKLIYGEQFNTYRRPLVAYDFIPEHQYEHYNGDTFERDYL